MSNLKERDGLSSRIEYHSWKGMINRCTNKNHHKYSSYGARGITVCDRWLNSLDNFIKDMGDRPSLDYSLDRINNDGNYEPSNCRWATRSQQMRNRRPKSNSGVSGIVFYKNNKKPYVVILQNDYKSKYYGAFPTLQEAIKRKEEVIREFENV